MKKSLLIYSLLSLAACSGAQRGGPPETNPLGQAAAVEVLEGAVADRDYGSATFNVRARLSNGTNLNVDVVVADLGAGFVYLNEQDRRNLNGAIPDPSEASQFHALRAGLTSGSREVTVLIIQDGDYEYLPNPRANERAPEDRTIDDVQTRLRREALDFLHAINENRGGRGDPRR